MNYLLLFFFHWNGRGIVLSRRFCVRALWCSLSIYGSIEKWPVCSQKKLRPVFTHIHTHSIHIYMCCLAILVMVVFIMYKNSNKNNIKFTIKVCACLELHKKVLANSGRQLWKEKTRLLGLQIGSFSPSVIANSHKSVL